MQMHPYGSSGLHVPVLGFGAMQVGEPSLDAPGVDCVTVGGTNVANVDWNIATVGLGPLKLAERSAIADACATRGQQWEGLV